MIRQSSKPFYRLREFFRIKYRQNIYEVGEHLHLYDASEKKPYVVKLTGIYRLNREGVGIVLKVEWLMKKEDLPYHKFTKYFEHLSVAEVFPSGQDDFVPVEAIMRKCHILTAVEYESLSNAGDAIHFSRAVYNRGTLELEPHPETWTKECYCQMPINPDVPYIQCDKCEHWFHHECIDNELLLNDDKFICKDCL